MALRLVHQRCLSVMTATATRPAAPLSKHSLEMHQRQPQVALL